jgi:hypothetical protein
VTGGWLQAGLLVSLVSVVAVGVIGNSRQYVRVRLAVAGMALAFVLYAMAVCWASVL